MICNDSFYLKMRWKAVQLKSLEIFVAVIECQSFSLAAEKLCTVQSNITSHIKKLENELGCELLFRHAPIRVTSAGEQLKHYAVQILKLHHEARHCLQQGKVDSNLPLRIGSMQTTAAVRLPELFQQLLHHEPQLPFHLHTDASRALMDQVYTGELDCAFIAHHKPLDGFFNLQIWSEQLVLVSALSIENPLDTHFLLQQKFIGFKQGCSYRRAIEIFLQKYQMPAAHIVEMGSLDAIISCTSMGMGLAILPLSYVQQSYYSKQVRTTVIDQTLMPVGVYLIANPVNTWSSNLKNFVQVIHSFRSSDMK